MRTNLVKRTFPTIEEIQSAFENEKRNAMPPRNADDLPFSYELVTDEWLTNVLCHNHPGAKVVSHRLGDADDGTSNRRRIYLQYNSTGQEAGLPPSVFCKSTQNLLNRIALGVNGALQTEVNFYKHVRPLLDIEAPKALWANYNAATFNSIVILEDIGDRVEFCSPFTEMTQARLRSQLDLLATLHCAFYKAPGAENVLDQFTTWADFFASTEAIDMEGACTRGFENAESVVPPGLFSRRDEIWPATIASAESHRTAVRDLIHSDVHLRNWYIGTDGDMGLTDWQIATVGHWARDVAYAMSTAMTVDQRRQWERELLAYYLGRRQDLTGEAIAFDDAWNHYRKQLFGALAFWTATLTPAAGMPDMQPSDVSLEFIKRMAHAIDDLNALD